MKNQPKTVIDTLKERLREQSKRFNPSLESVQVVVPHAGRLCDTE